MPDRLLNTSFANWTGGTTVILSIWFKSMELFNLANINDLLVLLTTIGGLIFLFFKIKSIRLDNKIKQHNYDKAIREEE